MLNLNSIMMGTSNPGKLAKFYEKVLGKPDMAEKKWYGWSVGNSYLTIGEHSKVNGKAKDPSRMMFNLETRQVKKEFNRIKSKGAKVVQKPYNMEGMWIATFADPDGNYFQLMSPWKA
ncbi:MAG: hypothetical protein EPN86_01040 [Nanoarchaeota archaeon]|nr:MAG: hypothetical protein EPN86_01040 [Nanoarchaeota archaeon]